MSNRELTAQEKSCVLKAKALNAPFLAVRSTMPMQYWNTFLMIAADEGLSVIEYARRAGLSQSVMSRHILDIGDKNRNHGEGFGFVTSKYADNSLREKQIWLTDKGRAVVRHIVDTLERQ